MKHLRFGAVFVPLVAVAVAALMAVAGGGARNALACSYPPPSWQWSNAETIFEGRVLEEFEDTGASDESTRAIEVRVQVKVALRGVAEGDILALHARVPQPDGPPQMCQAWPKNQRFEGQYMVGNLTGYPEVSRGFVTAFLGDEPAGLQYESASRWARLTAGIDSTLPALRVTRSGAECGGELTVAGSRFEPGTTVLVNYPGSWNAPDGRRPEVEVGSNGSFVRTFALPVDICAGENTFQMVEAYPADPNQQLGGYPLAFVAFDGATTVPGPPDTGNTMGEQGSSGFGTAATFALVAVVGGVAGIAVGAHRARANRR